MKTQWRKLKGFPNYKISNKGAIVNIKSGRQLSAFLTLQGTEAVCLSKNNRTTTKSLGRLVLKHFTKKPPRFTTVHLDGDLTNNKRSNLKRGTRSEAMLIARRAKAELRGISKWSIGNKKWRAVLAYQGKVNTVGYFNTKKEAIKAYFGAYKNMHGVKPFNLKAKLK